MAGQIDEEVLETFIVGEDDFKDLDAVVRRHCETVKYYVYRGNVLGGYDTDDVEVLLKERNGSGAKIESVLLHATGQDRLKFNVNFHDTVDINGECEDRASLNTVYLRAEDDRGVLRPAAGLGPGAVAGCLGTVAAHFPLDDSGRGALAARWEQLAHDLLVGLGMRGVKRLRGKTRGGRRWCAGPPATCG